jgi:CubicO group peptidase (beta-lactamase class C family)
VNQRLPRSTPEAEGVSSAAIASLVAALDAGAGTHSYMLLRHGAVIAEGWWAPYEAGMPHSMFSVSKSFTATAVGLAIADGLFDLDSRVVELLPDDAPDDISPNLAAMRVRDLLTMTSGHESDTVSLAEEHRAGNWAKAILALPIVHAPGTMFVYNSGATYLLSAIVTRATGERLLDYLGPRILEPLGITGATWEQSPSGIDAGGWGLSITTEDLAAFGELYRRRGVWNGIQLVPAEWVEAATSHQVPNKTADSALDGSLGYGYQFWRSQHDAYRADGAFGQFAIVMPEHDAVLALTGGVTSNQASLDTVWQHLLAAFDSTSEPTAIPPLALPVPVPVGAGTRRPGPTIVQFAADAMVGGLTLDGSTLHADAHGSRQSIEFGSGSWLAGSTTFGTGVDTPIAASAAWTSDNTWVGVVWFTETPFSYRIELSLDGDQARLDITVNVSFGSTEIAHQVGTVQV